MNETVTISLEMYVLCLWSLLFFFSSRRRHTRSLRDWSSDVCSSDLGCNIDSSTTDVVVPATNQRKTPADAAKVAAPRTPSFLTIIGPRKRKDRKSVV